MWVKMKKMIIGITGLIGDGKSKASNVFKNRGVTVIDVDRFAHKLYKKGTKFYKKLIKIYGKKILSKNGNINRNALGKIIFFNKEQYKKFTALIYPVLNRTLKNEIEKIKSNIIVLDMAVLFQSGFYKNVDKIIFIRTSDRIWKKRFKRKKYFNKIFKIRQIQKENIKTKMIALCDFIVYNNSSEKHLKDKINKILEKFIILAN